MAGRAGGLDIWESCFFINLLTISLDLSSANISGVIPAFLKISCHSGEAFWVTKPFSGS